MKNYKSILYTCSFIIATIFIGCEDWNDPTPIVLPQTNFTSLTPKEEAELIKYKNSDHKLFFAWMNYSPATPSMQTRLRGIPDSLDIVSFFTGYVNNKQNREDVKFLQEHRGTKVLLTMWPENYFSTKGEGKANLDSMKTYAKNLVDSINAWGLDGFDLDYEPWFGGAEYSQEMMRTFIDIMSQHFGPMAKEENKINGKDKLLMIDGQWLDAEYADRFNYFIGQAYNSSSEYSLTNRLEGGWSDYGKGFPNEKRILCEWVSQVGNAFGQGGVSYRYGDNNIPSLWGMAHFAQDKGTAGCGAYVLQFGYAANNHLNKPVPPNNYYYARQAIQIMNPSKKSLVENTENIKEKNIEKTE